MSVWENVIWETICRENVCRRNVIGELFIGELSVGEKSIGEISIAELSGYLFDCNLSLEVRSVFLDKSKAFDKVWHQDLLYKLKSLGISGELYDLLEHYLSGRFQNTVLNGLT